MMDGMDVVQERDGTNAVKTNYLRAGNIGGLLAKSRRVAGQADVPFYFHYDGSGNVGQLTDAAQNVVATYTYDAWGNLRSKSGVEADANLYRFATKEVQSNGLYDFGLRFYSPGLGRFINRDPSDIAGGLNLYKFGANSPTNNTDAYGLSFVTFAQGFAVGAGVSLVITLAMGVVAVAFPAVGAFLAAAGEILGAPGVALLLIQLDQILNSNLCPDERDYQLGMLCGSIAGGWAGTKFGPKLLPKLGPKNGPLPGPEGEPPPVAPKPPSEPEPPVGSPCCFVAGTQVVMADGSLRPIEQVKAGDWVLSRDEKTGQTVKRQVEKALSRLVWGTVRLQLSNGQTIETTTEHPFYVQGRGFVPAKDLGIGTSIVTRAGPTLQLAKAPIFRRAFLDGKFAQTTVYNFTVHQTHSYFVLAAFAQDVRRALWVHNTSPLCVEKALAPKAPKQVEPGTRELSGEYLNDGRVEPWQAHYDEYGRQIGRTDFNAGDPSANIPPTHYHIYEYGPGYSSGKEVVSHAPGVYQP